MPKLKLKSLVDSISQLSKALQSRTGLALSKAALRYAHCAAVVVCYWFPSESSSFTSNFFKSSASSLVQLMQLSSALLRCRRLSFFSHDDDTDSLLPRSLFTLCSEQIQLYTFFFKDLIQKRPLHSSIKAQDLGLQNEPSSFKICKPKQVLGRINFDVLFLLPEHQNCLLNKDSNQGQNFFCPLWIH